MGDTSAQSGAQAGFQQQDAPPGQLPVSSTAEPSTMFSPQQMNVNMQQQQYGSPGVPPHAFSSQLDAAQSRGSTRPGGAFNMAGMANALPQAPYGAGPYGPSQSAYNPAAVPSSNMAVLPPVSPYGVQNPTGPTPSQQFYIPHHAQMPQYYSTTPMSPPSQGGAAPTRPDLAYYPNTMVVGQQPHAGTQFYYAQTAHVPGRAPQGQPQLVGGHYMTLGQQAEQILPSQLHSGGRSAGSVLPGNQDGAPADSRRNAVRGPPRKPRQSGHAIWIGNLPPQTDLMSLVHHVCKEAAGLESLFLISKSNCAFANFKDEEACAAAQRKLHDSKFQSVRLVSRLRKSTVEGAAGVTAPTGPAASAPQTVQAQDQNSAWDVGSGEDGESVSSPVAGVDGSRGASPVVDGGAAQKDRYFILKSLTVEDLELSVRTGVWATQAHNEETLNKAFKTADNVYLVFSANKSGEYFGYARMVSPINDDPTAAIEFAPKVQSPSEVDLPKAIPTEGTEFVPKGRIIDDSARGTIFWEVEQEEQGAGGSGPEEEGSGGGSVGDTNSVKSGHDGGTGESKAWGKPFRLEWLSITKLPFYRTRGLRNPWNSNREVKIARDGTELQPAVGRKLIGLFSHASVQSPAIQVMPGLVPGSVPSGPAGGLGFRGPVPVTVGFPPPMRPAFHPPR